MEKDSRYTFADVQQLRCVSNRLRQIGEREPYLEEKESDSSATKHDMHLQKLFIKKCTEEGTNHLGRYYKRSVVLLVIIMVLLVIILFKI